MRLLIEEAKGLETESLDGLKVRDEGWVSLMPDPDQPLFHVTPRARRRRTPPTCAIAIGRG